MDVFVRVSGAHFTLMVLPFLSLLGCANMRKQKCFFNRSGNIEGYNKPVVYRSAKEGVDVSLGPTLLAHRDRGTPERPRG